MKHYSIPSLLLAASLLFTGCDEPGQIVWKNKGHEKAAGIAQLNDGNYCILGSHCMDDGVTDFVAITYDSAGQIKWTKTYGGSAYDSAHAIKATPDGGAILAGYTESYGIGENDDIWNVWVIKIDKTGAMQWNSSAGTLQHDEAADIALTADGGYIAAGYTHQESNPGIYAVKFSATGAVEWTKSYGHGCASSIAATNDGNFIITAQDRISFYDQLTDISIVKIDPAGNIIWDRTVGTSQHDRPGRTAVLSDGSIIIAGNTIKSDGFTNNTGLVIKTDAAGTVQWTKELALTSGGAVTCVAQGSDGNIIIAGDSCPDGSYNDFWIVKLDKSGKELWNKTHGTGATDTLAGILIDSADAIVLGGDTLTDALMYKFDLLGIRLTPDGDM